MVSLLVPNWRLDRHFHVVFQAMRFQSTVKMVGKNENSNIWAPFIPHLSLISSKSESASENFRGEIPREELPRPLIDEHFVHVVVSHCRN